LGRGPERDEALRQRLQKALIQNGQKKERRGSERAQQRAPIRFPFGKEGHPFVEGVSENQKSKEGGRREGERYLKKWRIREEGEATFRCLSGAHGFATAEKTAHQRVFKRR